MPDHLIFTLTANLGAMGELAGHERRGSLGFPGRSAIIGLLGAALGIRRQGDFSALDALSIAVAIFDEGEILRDYHTIETVPTAQAKRPQSRPEALRLAKGKTNTTITLRDYRCGPLYGVALWNGELSVLKAALERPHFTLYLGRKSCPLSAPTWPRIVEADGPAEALNQLVLPPWHKGKVASLLAADEGVLVGNRIEQRNDIPIDRAHWHFAPRNVMLANVHIAPEATP